MMKGLTRPDGDLRTLLSVGSIGALPDGALLDLFEGRPGEVTADRAFETLVDRHGALVLRVARGRLASEEDARDAFQATFWLLARRSRSIRNRDALAGWLFGVATRVAVRASVEATRRRARERQAALPLEDRTTDPAHHDPDLAPAIQREVNRLPAKYRVAVILCDFEGLSYDEAASRLGCPVGTFKARLSRARARLRVRLAHRGFAPADWQSTPPRPLVVPFSLIQSASRLALSGPSAAVASIVNLAQGAARTMTWSKISLFAAAAILLVGSTIGGLWGGEVLRPIPDEPASPQRKTLEPAKSKLPPLVEQLLSTGLAAAEAEPDLSLSVRYLIQVGRSYSNQGDHASATAAFQRARARLDQADPIARRKWFHEDPLARIALALAWNGDKDLAHQTFGHALNLIEALPPAEFVRSWSELIPTQIRAEDRAAARDNIQWVRSLIEKHRADILPAGTADHFLIRLQAMSGDFAGALAAVDALPVRVGIDPADDRVQLLVELAQVVREADGTAADGALDAACQAVLRQVSPPARVRNLVALIKVVAKLDRVAAVQRLMAAVDAELADPAIPELIRLDYLQTLGTVGRHCLDRRDDEAVRRNGRHVIELLDRFPIFRQQPTYNYYLSEVSYTLIMIGDETLLFDLASRMPNDEALAICYGSAPVGLRIRRREAEARRYDDRVVALFRRNIEAAPKNLDDAERLTKDMAWEIWSGRLAQHHAARGEVGKALATIKPLPLMGQHHALPTLTLIMAKAGYLAEALDMPRWTTDSHVKRNIAIQAAVGVLDLDRWYLDALED